MNNDLAWSRSRPSLDAADIWSVPAEAGATVAGNLDEAVRNFREAFLRHQALASQPAKTGRKRRRY